MKALSLWQPWAQFIAVGAKRYETRSWFTDYRGPLAIHASKHFSEEDRQWCWGADIPRQVCLKHGLTNLSHFSRGSIVAIADLVSVVPTERADLMSGWGDTPVRGGLGRVIVSKQEEALGDYAPHRWVWVLSDVMPLAQPVPILGHQGLWDWDISDAADEIRKRVHR